MTVIYASTSGYLRGDGTSYAEAHQAGTATAFSEYNVVDEVGQVTFNNQVYRACGYFNTSGVSGITEGTLSLYGWTDGAVTDFDVVVVSGTDLQGTDFTGYNNLVEADYGELFDETTLLGTANTSGFAESAWFDIPLNSAGVAAINASGITRFAIRSSRDIGSNAPTGDEYIEWLGMNGSATLRPKLTLVTAVTFIPVVTIM